MRAEEGAEAVLALGGSLRKWHDQKHLMCCTRRGRTKGEEDSAPQIPSNHAYAIVDVRKQEAVLLRHVRTIDALALCDMPALAAKCSMSADGLRQLVMELTTERARASDAPLLDLSGNIRQKPSVLRAVAET